MQRDCMQYYVGVQHTSGGSCDSRPATLAVCCLIKASMGLHMDSSIWRQRCCTFGGSGSTQHRLQNVADAIRGTYLTMKQITVWQLTLT
jgi:hypothetical protein